MLEISFLIIHQLVIQMKVLEAIVKSITAKREAINPACLIKNTHY